MGSTELPALRMLIERWVCLVEIHWQLSGFESLSVDLPRVVPFHAIRL